MAFDSGFIREMAKNGVQVIQGNIRGNINPQIEWLKWLAYEPEFEKKRIAYLNSKRVGDLSYQELEEACRYKENRRMARLFKIYGTRECSEEDYLLVYEYMNNESIEELMLSKLTATELKYVKKEIRRLSKISKEELEKKVNREKSQDNYEKMAKYFLE